MEREITDLLTLQKRLKKSIEGSEPEKLWLRAEIASLKWKPGGHCYIDLAQSDENGLVAKAQATIWANRYNVLGPYFEAETGMPLQNGITVLLYVQVTYSTLYGLSLNVTDIDPAFTLGEREKLRRETIQRLEKEGLMNLQKRLPKVELPRRIAVISASDAAGFGDFMKHLNNPYGFTFNVTLFPALMQGSGCPDSIISAFEDILLAGSADDAGAADGAAFDVVFIMRGGGSELDLSWYDDYGLCAALARFPLPVFTAIGHDKDFHIADMVAHDYAKTPTALADMLVEWYEDADAEVSSYASRLRLAFTSKISAMESRVMNMGSRIRMAIKTKLTAMEGQLNVLETKIREADPRKIIARGYVLAVDGAGRAVKSVDGRSAGDEIRLMLADGTLDCTVDSVTMIEK